MSNEELFLLRCLIEGVLLIIAGRMGSQYLYAFIIANLLLVPLFGQKLVLLFGIITNAGNVSYASAIIAAALIIERDDKKERLPLIGMGLIASVTFVSIAVSSAMMHDTQEGAVTGGYLSSLFSFAPRISAASFSAYAIAMMVFSNVYLSLKDVSEKALWFRVFVSCVIAQAVDSIIFYTLAFSGVLPVQEILVVMLFGFLTKCVVSLLLLPFVSLSLNRSLKNLF